jgi:F-type H+-transporting ATPase subunit gamma
MPPLKEVRNRIKSVKNISQITRALEAVSASRVRRAQARTLASRAYADKAWEILVNLQRAGTTSHPLLTAREEVRQVMIVVITSDRGLAGSYNTNVLRVAERFEERIGKPVQYIAVGRKGRDSLIRSRANVVAEFSDLPAEPTIGTIAPISRLAIDAFMSGEVDEVVIAYTDFINLLAQRPVVRVWLPLSTDAHANRVASDLVKEMPDVTEGVLSYEYEPNAAAVLDEIVPRFTELQLYQALLESQSSEHAARMAAMRNATDNATQLVADLTLEYNKARQAAITSEILDIVGGANALQSAIESAADNLLQKSAALSTVGE